MEQWGKRDQRYEIPSRGISAAAATDVNGGWAFPYLSPKLKYIALFQKANRSTKALGHFLIYCLKYNLKSLDKVLGNT
ncbi:unnamed protein product [Sphenostylis stenocarpa]|uniref:Uncharacterized protein n=1 Tax=Sphenostylis stenocarpa TaxID=92480 RepID=A0AA86SMU0_9FABA|nr:unnamed protein product [Sphenostylis stenocarpa]